MKALGFIFTKKPCDLLAGIYKLNFLNLISLKEMINAELLPIILITQIEIFKGREETPVHSSMCRQNSKKQLSLR
jgi:hypothetical protein